MATVAEQRYEEAVDVERLQPHPKNAKLHDLSGIGRSIDENSFVGAIYAQESTGFIISGHGTLDAAVAHGLATVPVIWIDVDDDTAERLVAVLNRAQETAGYDEIALADLLKGIADRGELEAAGYDVDTYEDLLARIGLDETPEGDTDAHYSDDHTKRQGPMPEGPKPQRGLREMVVVLLAEKFEELQSYIEVMRRQDGGITTQGEALLAICREWSTSPDGETER